MTIFEKNPIVQVQSLSQSISTASDKLDILNEVSFSLAAGQTLAITGPSGSGKSTLLGLLAGLDKPTSGEVLLFGQALSVLDEDARAALRAGRIGFVFQSFQLLPSLSALENIALPLELAGRKDAQQRAENWLERVGLGARKTHTPRQLSGGEQQRVAIARAFVSEPEIIFADEPTGNLDQETGEHIIDLLFELNAQANTTLIMVTHDSSLARRCQQHLHLIAGHVQT